MEDKRAGCKVSKPTCMQIIIYSFIKQTVSPMLRVGRETGVYYYTARGNSNLVRITNLATHVFNYINTPHNFNAVDSY